MKQDLAQEQSPRSKVQTSQRVSTPLDKDTKKDVYWSVGSYLVPMIFSLILKYLTPEGYMTVGGVSFSYLFPAAIGLGLTAFCAYYWCFDKPVKSNIHWLAKAGLIIVFLPALALVEVPYFFLLGWI